MSIDAERRALAMQQLKDRRLGAAAAAASSQSSTSSRPSTPTLGSTVYAPDSSPPTTQQAQKRGIDLSTHFSSGVLNSLYGSGTDVTAMNQAVKKVKIDSEPSTPPPEPSVLAPSLAQVKAQAEAQAQSPPPSRDAPYVFTITREVEQMCLPGLNMEDVRQALLTFNGNFSLARQRLSLLYQIKQAKPGVAGHSVKIHSIPSVLGGKVVPSSPSSKQSSPSTVRKLGPIQTWSSAQPSSSPVASSSYHSTAPAPPPQRKNFESAIYARKPASNKLEILSARAKHRQARAIDSEDSEELSDYASQDSEGRVRNRKADRVKQRDVAMEEMGAVTWFNTCKETELIDVLGITPEQQASIIKIRPFENVDNLRTKLKAKKGLSPRLVEQYLELMQGYNTVDRVLESCEAVGNDLSDVIKMWSTTEAMDDASTVTDTGLSLTKMLDIKVDDWKAIKDPKRKQVMRNFITVQPSALTNVTMKDYQLMGLNWLNLLHTEGYSCILADEMGLGKTLQIIAFLTLLHSQDVPGPHLIIVPASTLENWMREFQRFSPSLNIAAYYGTQKEREELRYELLDSQPDVILTTYNLAQGHRDDRSFLRKMKFNKAVFDEGHVLKNSTSIRYKSLMAIGMQQSILLTGTPIQNNLQELVSLLNFILPEFFANSEVELRAIFKVKADAAASLLSRQRVSRAQKMMTPFVLRRKKAQVLSDLPTKTDIVEYCSMTQRQEQIYNSALLRSRSSLKAINPDEINAVKLEVEEPAEKIKPKKGAPKSFIPTGDSISNVLMDLRKAANHPLLFRRHYTDAKISSMAKDCRKEKEFSDSNLQYIIEDMGVMMDFELQRFCQKYKSVGKYAIDEDFYMDSGKIDKLKEILPKCKERKEKVLIFSQFYSVLQILEIVLEKMGMKSMMLTGSTPVDTRQTLVDKFSNDETIDVFLLSTKAGGMGINLVAANNVIIFDSDWNPHADKQACDRSYRIGQKKPVTVYTFVTRGTIEEEMLRLSTIKLQLDSAVQGQEDSEETAGNENDMKQSILKILREKAIGLEDNASALLEQENKVHDQGTPEANEAKLQSHKEDASQMISKYF